MNAIDPRAWLEDRLGTAPRFPPGGRADQLLAAHAGLADVLGRVDADIAAGDDDDVTEAVLSGEFDGLPPLADDDDDEDAELAALAAELLEDDDEDVSAAARAYLGTEAPPAAEPRLRVLSSDGSSYASALELAGSSNPTIASTAARYLAEHGHRQRREAVQAPPAASGLCGADDGFGRCAARFHAAECGTSTQSAVATQGFADINDPDAQAAAVAERRQMRELAGRQVGAFVDQNAAPYSLSAAIEANAGQVTTRGYGPQHREVRRAGRRLTMHSHSDDSAADTESARDSAAALRAQFDPVRETPAALAIRRLAAGISPGTVARNWADSR